MSEVFSGKVAFTSLTKHDEFNGESTGKFSLTVNLDNDSYEKAEALGLRIREREGDMQRKFTSKFDVDVVDADDNPYAGEPPRGSEVRVLANIGAISPQWGPSTYMNRVRVVVEGTQEDVENAEF